MLGKKEKTVIGTNRSSLEVNSGQVVAGPKDLKAGHCWQGSTSLIPSGEEKLSSGWKGQGARERTASFAKVYGHITLLFSWSWYSSSLQEPLSAFDGYFPFLPTDISCLALEHITWKGGLYKHKAQRSINRTPYLIPAHQSGNNEDPDCGFPSPPASTPPWCCHPTPAPGTSHCCWWGQAGRAGNPILPVQTPAPAARTCSCFSSSQHHAPSHGCNTCGGSKTESCVLLTQRCCFSSAHIADSYTTARQSLEFYFCWSVLATRSWAKCKAVKLICTWQEASLCTWCSWCRF